MLNKLHFLWQTRGKTVLESLELKYQFHSLWRSGLSLSSKHWMALKTTQSHRSLAGVIFGFLQDVLLEIHCWLFPSLLFGVSDEVFQCPRMRNNNNSSHTLHKDPRIKVGWMAKFAVTICRYENKFDIFHSFCSKVINICCNAI